MKRMTEVWRASPVRLLPRDSGVKPPVSPDVGAAAPLPVASAARIEALFMAAIASSRWTRSATTDTVAGATTDRALELAERIRASKSTTEEAGDRGGYANAPSFEGSLVGRDRNGR